MSAPNERELAKVETKPAEGGEPSPALQRRIRQQEILAELGVSALQGASLDQLLTDTVQLTAQGLDADFCKVLELLPSENQFLVRAGVGWSRGVVGVAKVGADLDSPAGYALRSGQPVISNHLEKETRFRTPELLRQHGVRRAMNVILQGDGKPFGVLEVDSRSPADFREQDIAFLQGAANLLGMAIEREREERKLRAALARNEALLKEMNHRVKNSLSIVSSMLRLQANDAGDEQVSELLNEASHRVEAIAKAHDQLSRGSDVDCMDVGKYIEALCHDLDESVAQCDVRTEIDEGIVIATDRAVSTALIVNELIANAAKYAYESQSGIISVKVARQGAETFTVSVRDEGAGMPDDLDPRNRKGLGMRIIASFTRQLGATIEMKKHDPGAEFIVSIPLQAPA
ncbi:sensor histidine kinase [Methylocystis sp.]|uniref:sensor histidine kinase n=1 Tax=Methylocystis sp. TaxID=1911079 RepID=UPI0027331639|nr:histidine kinase dimerization/phosphoacceptor domain -containing protein [Methylocystis sp.]MDP3553733.1 histidine kinase dimerization/phosphoacceptor domain -containing protein [Methylocystis sp.]